MPLRKFILFLFVLCASGKARAQNYDSLFAEREKIILAGVDYRKAMLHWDIPPIINNKLDINYERKMNLNLSWIGRIIWNYSRQSGGLYPNAGIRYYYNLEERIIKRWTKKLEKTSGFSADYFQADLTAGFNWGYNISPDSQEFEDKNMDRAYPKGVVIGPALKIGTQRRLWKHFFYDAFLGGQIIINYKARIIGGFSLGLVL